MNYAKVVSSAAENWYKSVKNMSSEREPLLPASLRSSAGNGASSSETAAEDAQVSVDTELDVVLVEERPSQSQLEHQAQLQQQHQQKEANKLKKRKLWGLGAVTVAALGGGAINGLRILSKSPWLGGGTTAKIVDEVSKYPLVFNPKLTDAMMGIGNSCLPVRISAAPQILSYRSAALWGFLAQIPAESRSYFKNWMPGTQWPQHCQVRPPPAPPLPTTCPSEYLAGVQQSLEPWHWAGAHVAWAGLAGVLLGSALIYFPPGRWAAQAVPNARNPLVIGVCVSAVGLLPFYALQLAKEIG